MKRNKFLKKQAVSPGFSAMLLAGIGGGSGYLLDALKERRKEQVDNHWIRPVMFGALATTPAVLYGMGRSKLDINPNTGQHGMKFMTRWFAGDNDFFKGNANATANMAMRREAILKNMSDKYQMNHPEKYASYREKKGYFGLKPIEVNDFNQEIWADASRGRTPLESAGIVSNTLAQTGARVGSNLVTPGQVINTMLNAGIGYGTAWVASHTIGALAGLSPQSREKLQEIGTWGGVINGIGNATSPY